MKISLPPFPMDRLIKEAVHSFNLRNPDANLDPEKSDWGQIYGAILAFLRHSQSQYYTELRAGGDRDRLHAELTTAAKFKYPWLRLSKDPRAKKSEPIKQLIYSERSKELSRLVTEKDHLIRAKRELKRAFHADYRERVEAINAQLAQLDARVAALYKSFQINKGVVQNMIPHDLSFQLEPGYVFAGRTLPENYTKAVSIPARLACPRCTRIVMATKRPLDHGCNIFLSAFSCHCLNVSVPDGFMPTIDVWERFIAEGAEGYGVLPRYVGVEL
jgi:hypothetical protein